MFQSHFIRISTYQSNDRLKRDAQTKDTNRTSDNGDDKKNDGEEKNDKMRKGRKFCEQGGVFCMLYKAINGDPSPSSSVHLPVERRDEISSAPRYEGPPTPCPAKLEYATPVFAKNYQGVWRYVVQIPYEGYFTQTVEVTRYVRRFLRKRY